MELTFSEMKKILLIYASAMMALCAVSCDKDRTGSSANKLVKEISYSVGYDDYRVSFEFEYDNENRLSKVVESYGDETYTMTYNYDGNIITEATDYNEEPSKYYLNSEGFLTKIEIKTSSLDTPDRTGTYYYLYEYENGLLKSCQTENFSTGHGEEYEWENGDMIMSKDLYVPNNYDKYEYTNFENNLNTNLFTLGYMGYYFDFKGTSSQHLPKTCTTEHPSYTSITDYSYEFDADGCVTKIIMTDRNDNSDREECNIIYY